MLKASELQAAAEAIIFASGDPLEIARIADALEIDTEYAEIILRNLSDRLEVSGSGLSLLRLGNKYQLCTRTEFAEQVRMVLDLKRNSPLSPAAFEVLAVVAYNQPVTKSYVEQVRGVDCTGVITTLCQKSLIEEKGRLDLPGRPLLYGTTPEFLKCFCISSLSELPELPEKDEDSKKNFEEGMEQLEIEQDISVVNNEENSENIGSVMHEKISEMTED